MPKLSHTVLGGIISGLVGGLVGSASTYVYIEDVRPKECIEYRWKLSDTLKAISKNYPSPKAHFDVTEDPVEVFNFYRNNLIERKIPEAITESLSEINNLNFSNACESNSQKDWVEQTKNIYLLIQQCVDKSYLESSPGVQQCALERCQAGRIKGLINNHLLEHKYNEIPNLINCPTLN